MSIRDWPERERPREKLLESGAAALSDAELLAILIRSGRRGSNAVELARGLLGRFGSLRALLSAEAAAFCRHPGLTPVRYAQLHAGLELARRHYETALRAGPGIDNPATTREFLIARLRDRPYEVFCCLYLDNHNRLIAFDELFRGSVSGANVHPREVVRQALARNAVGVIAAHNHPSGIAEPSQCDELVTRRLREALALVDIRLVDHLVVGDGRCVSFAERGLL
jgi:DNA repair protein RadC